MNNKQTFKKGDIVTLKKRCIECYNIYGLTSNLEFMVEDTICKSGYNFYTIRTSPLQQPAVRLLFVCQSNIRISKNK